MATKRIMAYFMHEDEEAAILQRLTGKKVETNGFIIGNVTDADRTQLQQKGIILIELPEIPKTEIQETPTLSAITAMEVKKAVASIREIPRMRRFTAIVNLAKKAAPPATYLFPNYFKLTLRVPLFPSLKDQLSKLDVEIKHMITNNVYLVYLTHDVVNELLTSEELKDNVSKVELYSEYDTGTARRKFFTLSVTGKPEEVKEKRSVVYDVFLHNANDMGSFVNWLTEKHVAVLGKSRNKIRARLNDADIGEKEIRDHDAVKTMEEFIPPRLHNDEARLVLGIDTLNSGKHIVRVPFDGKDQKIGVADTGIDANHVDLKDKIFGFRALGRPGDFSDTHGHGTHVTGSIVGNGSGSKGDIKGIATGATVFFQSLLDNEGGLGGLPINLQDLFEEAYEQGVRIHNNSWGSATKSRYTFNSLEVDEFAYSHLDMLIVVSAGNDGSELSEFDNSPPGYPELLSIGSPATAKNALTVGASRSSRKTGGFSKLKYGDAWPNEFFNSPIKDETISGDPEQLAGFSSRGPSQDYRIKPDLVAPGTEILSLKSSVAPDERFNGIKSYNGKDLYGFMSGTSMSAPIVSGCAALVREYYAKNNYNMPSAALVKATLINGCKPLAGLDAVVNHNKTPNYNQGFGLISMPDTLPYNGNKLMLQFVDTLGNINGQPFNTTGERHRFEIRLSAKGFLRLCLAYTDLPMNGLQNNLNLLLDYQLANGNRKKYEGNINRPPMSLQQLDTNNNVEVVSVEKADDTVDYTVAIMASNIISGPQHYALVVSSDVNFTFKPI